MDRTAGGIDGLRRAVEQLEEREAQQAALFADLARQVEAMATAVEVLRARVMFALIGSSIATALAIVALALLWRR
jgi:cephalosporin-C deacetylase-like acetyl esterase